ncbi:MAG: sedoheptulose 7-phosphate cyclase [Planctomycetota bacterium]
MSRSSVDRVLRVFRSLTPDVSIDAGPTQQDVSVWGGGDLDVAWSDYAANPESVRLLELLSDIDPYEPSLTDPFNDEGALRGVAPFRQLRGALGMTLGVFAQQAATLLTAFDPATGRLWQALADATCADDTLRTHGLRELMKSGPQCDAVIDLEDWLLEREPHAVYPTSPYRDGNGHTVARYDHQQVEAVMTSRTYTSIRVVEDVLNPRRVLLKELYQPHGRCVAIVDTNVEEHFGDAIEAYFDHHDIPLEKRVFRAMEVDKGIRTVEKLLGEFKALGVSRHEPVLVVGGGVLTDTAGLAAALYHRGTPYVMLSTSVVAGIDAGPSPRTCCDGHGYKNLFGAYHPPILSITDRTFFKTLHEGWLRHGIAEIIKMACVKDIKLFEALEEAGPALVETRFGATEPDARAPIHTASQKILGMAIQSYVEAEYGNLYETHQCRPHAFGHTWSPGFEIPAGLLHGHAVTIGMGFGAHVAEQHGFIDADQRDRILKLIQSFGLSLWHDVLENDELLWAAQVKMTQKRGGHLAAPLPKGEIGQCGYLNEMTRERLAESIASYRELCETLENGGRGVDPLCSDVGLEDPATVGDSLLTDGIEPA